jgi:hypothetical protein
MKPNKDVVDTFFAACRTRMGVDLPSIFNHTFNTDCVIKAIVGGAKRSFAALQSCKSREAQSFTLRKSAQATPHPARDGW